MSTQESPESSQLSFAEEVAASMTGVGVVWAQTSGGVIGNAGKMPWLLPEDLKHFSKLTTGHPVIMGRKSWQALPDAYRPLPGRTNIVVSRQKGWGETSAADGAIVVSSLDEALLESQFAPGSEKVWIIGGGEVFRQSMDIADIAVITVIDSEAGGDTYAPDLDEHWKQDVSYPREGWLTAANGTRYRFALWRRSEG
ncbi:dihydrofolate reductase [Arthrobacter sp. ISL-30]|uniref:dihydrofolate reductase n=1 Tax=Arthrobacter sp. ISL-30 TaxID=2819109 RepID=UPI001BE7311F|nr:dihydrofolate reductase [Arthrobacter sp. ISL-30]MBT2514460.1 dihydrofolate reductase [Arthrobacter sp. ISL-30]